MACAWSPETQGEGRHAGHRGAMNGTHPKASCFFTIVCPILYGFKWFFPYVSISPMFRSPPELSLFSHLFGGVQPWRWLPACEASARTSGSSSSSLGIASDTATLRNRRTVETHRNMCQRLPKVCPKYSDLFRSSPPNGRYKHGTSQGLRPHGILVAKHFSHYGCSKWFSVLF